LLVKHGAVLTPDQVNTLRKRSLRTNTGYAPERELSLPHHEPCGALGLDGKSALLLEVPSGLLGSTSVYSYLRICSQLSKNYLEYPLMSSDPNSMCYLDTFQFLSGHGFCRHHVLHLLKPRTVSWSQKYPFRVVASCKYHMRCILEFLLCYFSNSKTGGTKRGSPKLRAPPQKRPRKDCDPSL
jgi:hypothetical protein